MTPQVVVDIGNTRMKWGWNKTKDDFWTISLDRYKSDEWQSRWDLWQLGDNNPWLIASVDPARSQAFTRWLEQRGQSYLELRSYRQIPLKLDVETPEGVGLDRLLASLGALKASPFPPPFLVVQAGTALVVNFINGEGVFLGGSILPGFAMMAKALKDHTATLPEVPIRDIASLAPGRTTEQAIQLGIFAAALGTIQTLRERLGQSPLPVILTGGDGELLLSQILEPVAFLPDLVLGGLVEVGTKLP